MQPDWALWLKIARQEAAVVMLVALNQSAQLPGITGCGMWRQPLLADAIIQCMAPQVAPF